MLFSNLFYLNTRIRRSVDLSGWKISAKLLNDSSGYEGRLILDVKGGHFTAGKNEYFPIPQSEIDKTTVGGKPTLTQNKGYQ